MVDPYAEPRPRPESADAPPAPPGPPCWAGIVGELGGALVEQWLAVGGRPDGDRRPRFLVVASTAASVGPLARLGPIKAAMLALADSPEPSDAQICAPADLLAALRAFPGPIFAARHGQIAGPPDQPGAVEVDRTLLRTLLEAALLDTIEWERDPDFGYEVPATTPATLTPDQALACRPRLLFTAHGRVYEHARLVAADQSRRRSRLDARPDVPAPILAATGWPPRPTSDSWKGAAPAMVERSSTVAVGAADLWSAVTTQAGVNYELAPFVRMRMPPSIGDATIDDFPIGASIGRCWMLLGGFIPVDYDDVCLSELEPGRRFLEQSKMASLSFWQHERIIEPAGPDAATVTDRLAFRARRPLAWIPGHRRPLAAIVGALFSHRHRRLTARFGAARSIL